MAWIFVEIPQHAVIQNNLLLLRWLMCWSSCNLPTTSLGGEGILQDTERTDTCLTAARGSFIAHRCCLNLPLFTGLLRSGHDSLLQGIPMK